MNQQEIKELFEIHAQGYDHQWIHAKSMNDCLYLLMNGIIKEDYLAAKVLCVGAGTGNELLALAHEYPQMSFTVVEPARAMIELCKTKMAKAGYLDRCEFVNGYVENVDSNMKHDIATAFLVSHFMVDKKDRIEFFQQINNRLNSDGILISTDLTADTEDKDYEPLLQIWFNTMWFGLPNEQIEARKKSYNQDVGLIAADELKNLIKSSGFAGSFCFYQAGMIQGFVSYRHP